MFAFSVFKLLFQTLLYGWLCLNCCMSFTKIHEIGLICRLCVNLGYTTLLWRFPCHCIFLEVFRECFKYTRYNSTSKSNTWYWCSVNITLSEVLWAKKCVLAWHKFLSPCYSNPFLLEGLLLGKPVNELTRMSSTTQHTPRYITTYGRQLYNTTHLLDN